MLDYVLRRCEYDMEYDKWVAIEASKRIALYCSRTCRKYTIQELIRIINKQSVDNNEFNEDEISDAHTELPEDPRTSLSTPAPPPFKRRSYSHSVSHSHSKIEMVIIKIWITIPIVTIMQQQLEFHNHKRTNLQCATNIFTI